MSTIHELVASARRRLRDAGISAPEADLDARVLAEHLLAWDAAGYFAHGDRPAPEEFSQRYGALVERRVRREPVAYITGVQEFWNLTFEVTPAVLIPRPETELVVEAFLEQRPSPREVLRVADACTGSGCLAVAIARERPAARVIATDISADALVIAKRNAARHHVEERITLMKTDVLEGVTGPFDAIVSNPPYVPEGEAVAMQPEVVDHEPHIALFAGADGLAVIRRLVAQAAVHLAPAGVVIFEFGFGHSDEVARLVGRSSALELVELRRDLQNIPRTAIAKRVR